MFSEMAAQGIPPNWQCVCSVTCRMMTAARQKTWGHLLQEPFDVMTFGRNAVVGIQPALFSRYAGDRTIRVPRVNVPNSFCWNELMTTDTQRTVSFIPGLFGWAKDVQNSVPWNTRCLPTTAGQPEGC